MALSDREIDAVLRMVAGTREDEIDCDGCLAGLSAFAERELAGKPVGEAQRAVEAHLETCSECREEYRSLLEALKGLE